MEGSGKMFNLRLINVLLDRIAFRKCQKNMPKGKLSLTVRKKDGKRVSGKSQGIVSLVDFIKGKGNLCYYANTGNWILLCSLVYSQGITLLHFL